MTAANGLRRLALSVLVIALANALGGCATYHVWRKCAGGCPGDAELSAAVRARLGAHTELLAPNRVDVRVLDGVVYLSGQVATDLQRTDAELIARTTPGAPPVVDMISLEYNGR
jgi:osmotically-inducible protein OsmY